MPILLPPVVGSVFHAVFFSGTVGVHWTMTSFLKYLDNSDNNRLFSHWEGHDPAKGIRILKVRQVELE